jgi:hypothetical protein
MARPAALFFVNQRKLQAHRRHHSATLRYLFKGMLKAATRVQHNVLPSDFARKILTSLELWF